MRSMICVANSAKLSEFRVSTESHRIPRRPLPPPNSGQMEADIRDIFVGFTFGHRIGQVDLP